MNTKVMEVLSIRQDGDNFDRRFFHNGHGSAMKKLVEKLIEPESHPDRVGPRITALRETLSMSKAQFADSLDFDRSSLTKVEKGQTGLDIAVGIKIAVLYGFGLDFIYRGDLSDVPSDLRTRLMVNLVTYAKAR
jgi:DNA-binding XRE family transcriptional regulator